MAIPPELKSILDNIHSIKLDEQFYKELKYHERRNPQHVQEIDSLLKPLLDIFKSIEIEYLDKLPGDISQGFLGPAGVFNNFLDEIPTFHPDNKQYASLLSEIQEYYNSHFNHLIKYANISSIVSNELELNLVTIYEIMGQLEQRYAQIENLAKDVVVGKSSIFFKLEAKNNGSDSCKWLGGLAAGIVAVVYLTFANMSNRFPFHLDDAYLELLKGENGSYYLFQLSMSKLILFGAASFMTFFCSKNYIAAKHNQTLNKHRHLALQTYRALVDASKNSEIILQHAASAIYSPQSTGYTQDKVDAPTAKSVVEMFQRPE